MQLDPDTLVSCVMPTHDRRAFVPMAIRYFLRQDYPLRELIIVDDGPDSVSDLIPDDPAIRYIRLDTKATIGEKLNLACDGARGTVIANWDDDDWYASHRLRYQMSALLKTGSDMCGINDLLYYDLREKKAFRYVYPPGSQPQWLSGSTLCFSRQFWLNHPFDRVDVGVDWFFVAKANGHRIHLLDDNTFSVHMIHAANVSPKQTESAYWQPHEVHEVATLVGDDWSNYVGNSEREHVIVPCLPEPEQREPARAATRQIRNVFACLVHEAEECVIDLVRNLRHFDPSSTVLLYDGSENGVLQGDFPFERYGAMSHPAPRRQAWGRLHEFALDCMDFALAEIPFDTLTVVDSDQLMVRTGYTELLSERLSDESDVGMLVQSPEPQPLDSSIGPAAAACAEIDLWRPFLTRFHDGEAKFPHWSFWPATVFTSDAARDLVHLFKTDTQLGSIMTQSRIWATEEVIFPTLTALLGYRIVRNPGGFDFVKFRQAYEPRDLASALAQSDVFWMHPIPRRYDDAVRVELRERHSHYVTSHGSEVENAHAPGDDALFLHHPILEQMRDTEGWLEEAEADLLIAVTSRALTTLPGPHAIVEVGSYCGRATVVLAGTVKALRADAHVFAIDPHDGRLGALDRGIVPHPPSAQKLRDTLEASGLTDHVQVIQQRATDTPWSRDIHLLLIDGLHDYTNVARDFLHFEPRLVDDAIVAFHDYADYYPGVVAFVNELLDSGEYRRVHLAETLVVLQKTDFAHREG